MKKSLFVLILMLSFNPGLYAQVAVSYYPFNSFLGVSTNPNKTIWGDLRLETNTFISNTNMELSPKINVKNTDIVKAYIGPGVNFNIIYGLFNNGQYLNGYFLTGGVLVTPFRKVRNLGFIFELSPYVNYTLNGGYFRTNLGLSWHFNKRANKIKTPQKDDGIKS